jgi:hypothetical protein
MPQSRKRKPKQKVPAQPTRKRKIVAIPRKVWATLLAFCTLIGILALWPRVSVQPTGDFSNPASIQFVIANAGYVPLRRISVGLLMCDLIYGGDKGILKNNPEIPCNLSQITKSTPPQNAGTIGIDDSLTLRLEDLIRAQNTPILRAILVLTIFYYPSYLPIRMQKRFGFRTAEGSDGKLYWRTYPVE